MTRKLDRNSFGGGLTTLPLKHATTQVDSRPPVAIGTVSLEFAGRCNRSVRLALLPKNLKTAYPGIQFEIPSLSCVIDLHSDVAA
jgi:hypothetical protein